MYHIKDLPEELNTLIHSYLPYKQNFDKVVEDIIRFDVYDCWEGERDEPFYGMNWNGKYTNGTIWIRGTSMRFTNYDEHIQVHSLMEVINYIDGKTHFPYANNTFGCPETLYSIYLDDECPFLLGDIDARNELVRVDKIAKRHRVTQWWI